MAAQTRVVLKGYFETDDVPTEGQFSDFIDSDFNLTDNDTDDITEGSTNLFYTEERATASINAAASSDSSTSVLSLTNPIGIYYDMGSASATTTYTTTGTTLGAWGKVLINTTSEPTVTGGTKISGATWVTGTNMYLVCTHNGTRVEYWFLEI